MVKDRSIPDRHPPMVEPLVPRRPSAIRRGLGVAALCAALILLLSACEPTPVVDEPATNLVAKATIIDTEASPADGKVPVFVQFFSNGNFVQLGSAAAVTCNGISMPWNGLGYAERVPIVGPGDTYDCRHIRLGVTSSLVATVPARPVIISPTLGASVPRSSTLAVTYVADAGTGVRVSAGDASTGLGGNLQPDNGSSTVDVSSLKPGPGSIGVVREFTFAPAAGGFQSASVVYSSGSDIDVTWT